MTEDKHVQEQAPEATTVYAEDHLEEGNDLGSIRIHNHVIGVIAKLAALNVPGVVELSGTISDGLAGMIGKRSSDRGVRIETAEAGVTVECAVVLEYGVRIPQVAWQLQHDVREAVENMTGEHVHAVNVVVQGVRLNDSADKQLKGAES